MLVASLDLSSAFDTINGSKLLSRLRDLEIPPYLLSWLQNYVNDRHCVIKVADQEFTYPVLSACPQGSPLSPLLFNLYVNQVLELHDTLPPLILQDSLSLTPLPRNPAYRLMLTICWCGLQVP